MESGLPNSIVCGFSSTKLEKSTPNTYKANFEMRNNTAQICGDDDTAESDALKLAMTTTNHESNNSSVSRRSL